VTTATLGYYEGTCPKELWLSDGDGGQVPVIPLIPDGCPTHSRFSNEWDRDAVCVILIGHSLTIDLYQALFAAGIPPVATPFPLFGSRYQTTFYWIAMYVAQLFDALRRTAHIKVIETLLPDRTGADAAVVNQLGEPLLDDFHYDRRIAYIRFADQEVEMLGHDDVADHHKSISLPCTLQNAQEEIAALGGSQLGPPPVTATGYEMQMVPTIPTLETFRHTPSLGADHICGR
jgi:hypothetical protein